MTANLVQAAEGAGLLAAIGAGLKYGWRTNNQKLAQQTIDLLIQRVDGLEKRVAELEAENGHLRMVNGVLAEQVTNTSAMGALADRVTAATQKADEDRANTVKSVNHLASLVELAMMREVK